MYIKKVNIYNYKCFEGLFSLELNRNVNILVGDNEVGKSTILEAIQLALSGLINGKYLKSELVQGLFNKQVVDGYLNAINSGGNIPLPYILVELIVDFDDEALDGLYTGDFNSKTTKQTGFNLLIKFDEEKYKEVYDELLKELRTNGQKILSLPIEYFDVSWTTFARKQIVPRMLPLRSSLIDSASTRYRNGSDMYISQIIKDGLLAEDEVKIAQAHRQLKDNFSSNPDIQSINTKINQGDISDGVVSIEVDLSTKTSWETSLVTCIDGIPFHQVGKGEQAMVKTKLALKQKKAQSSNVLLIEEPENHLSHARLNKLIYHVKSNHEDKQVIITSHSSFVANKLGLKNLILLNQNDDQERFETRITDLEPSTQKYFERLSGYDTLRLVLSRRVILVEGDSDELIVQRAYFDKNGKLPIEDEVDVISVRSLAFKRYLHIAKNLGRSVRVVTDNDGDYAKKIVEKYEGFENDTFITICADADNDLPSLEQQILNANKDNLNLIAGILSTHTENPLPAHWDVLLKFMQDDKVGAALSIFESEQKIIYPDYILRAIEFND